jgi:hypothetical protein
MNIYANISRLLSKYGSAETPTHAENREHFMRLITCEDETELNAYAISNIRMVASVVARFLKRHPWAGYLVDDIFSSALCQLFISLRSLVDKANQAPEDFWTDMGHLDEDGRFPVSMYLYISTYRSVQRCFEMDAVQAISPSTAAKFTPEGLDKPIRKWQLTKMVSDSLECDHFGVIYLWDDILEHCETDFEQSVIKMRLDMNDQEIADILGGSRQRVQWARDRVHERYKQSLQESSE